MKAPSRSLKLIRREIENARKHKTMAVVHPDTLEWLLQDNAGLAESLRFVVANITNVLRLARAKAISAEERKR
jgi:hypothetical protein